MLRTTLLAALMLGGAYMPAFAQEFTAVSTIERMVETTNADGTVSTEFIAVERVVPGETLYYKLAYDNASSDTAENVSLVMNVPPEVTYNENTTSSLDADATVFFSTDGGESFFPRGELSVTASGQERPAVSEDITNIRWTFNEPIAPGTEGVISFTATVR